MSEVGTDAWFIDNDDNTRIRITEVGSGLFFAQTTEDSFGACAITSSGALITVDALPSDFQADSGSVSRLGDRLSLFIEESTLSLLGGDPAIFDIPGGPRTKSVITRFDFINVETLGISGGGNDQVFQVSGNTILTPTLGTPIIFVGELDGERWTRTADLLTASAIDKVFEYDATLGKVQFGDGVNGAIPEIGKNIILRITIRDGGGKWKSAGIVVDKGFAQVGNVKSVRDKILYATAPIHAIDFRRVVNVSSSINIKEQSEVSEISGNPILQTVREWSFDYGGTVTGTAGSPTTLGVSSNFRSVSASLVPINGHGASIPAEGDTTHSLLNQLHSSFDVSGANPRVAIAQASDKVTEPSTFNVILDSDLVSGQSVSFNPIFYVFEVIQFGFIRKKLSLPPTPSCSPGDFEFVANLNYSIYWAIWNGPLQTQSVLHTGWNPTTLLHTGVEDSSDDDFGGTPIGVPGTPIVNAFPISGRMIAIGDVIGSFDSPARPQSDIDANLPTQPDANTSFGSGGFRRTVDGDNSRLPALVTMTYEDRTVDAAEIAYETYLFGSPVSPSITTISATEGSVTTLPDVPIRVCPANELPTDQKRELPHGGRLTFFISPGGIVNPGS